VYSNNEMNPYLADKLISEYVHGGPTYLRPSYQATDQFASYRNQILDEPQKPRGRIICVKLPWLFAIVKLPYWSHIGQPLRAD